MSTNFQNDPRLTAYALGELTPSDRAAFEQQLAGSAEASAELAAIRSMGEQLRSALKSEPALPVTDFVAPAPMLISTSGQKEISLRHRWISKVAVAASCVALIGTFSWVSWYGNRQTNSKSFAEATKLAPTTRQLADRSSVSSVSRADLAQGLSDYDSLSVIDHEFAAPAKGMISVEQQVAATSTGPTSSRTRVLDAYNVDPVQKWEQEGLARNRFTKESSPRGSTQVANGTDLDKRDFKRLSVIADDLSSTVQEAKQLPAGQTPQVLKGYAKVGQPSGAVDGEKQLKDQQPLVRLQAQSDRYYRESDGRERRLTRGLEELKLKQEVASFEFRRKEQLQDLAEQVGDRTSAEGYAAIQDNPFFSPLQQPLSTFSIDVDTAAYSNMRRFLTQGNWPPADSVRIEELVNYFTYDYAPPAEVDGRGLRVEGKLEPANLQPSTTNHQPFAVHMEVAGCPWNAEHRLVRVGLKGKEIALDKRPVSNIVFLIDVSGSMQDANKLPLVKAGLRRLVEQFNENDRVGIAVYAGASGLALDSTNATQKDVILSAIENLQAGGSTNGAQGIQLAYSLARKNFINKGTNRVILCTDGDFNVGITNKDDLTRLIEEEAKSGVFLSVLGFGMGNLKDDTLEKLADKGNGNYAYIDTLREANKVFVEQMTGTLITIAKDVKIQIEFNPSQVGAYRLIGYENRVMAAQDFRDDTKDAGEIGAGHTVTALYEIIPPSKLSKAEAPAAETKLKYQPSVNSPASRREGEAVVESPKSATAPSLPVAPSNELLTIHLRYKQPDAEKSDAEIEQVLLDKGQPFAQASTDFRWAASVASFGMILRNSPHRGNTTLDAVAEIAQAAMGADKSGYRSEFVNLVQSAKALQQPRK